MTNALNDLAPYRTENFNRFGLYDLRFDRVLELIKNSSILPINLMN